MQTRTWVVGCIMLGTLTVVSAGSGASPGLRKSSMASLIASGGEMLRPLVERACPPNMSLVGKTCVDKYEGALVEIRDDGTETTFSPYEAPNGHHVRAVSRPGVVPQGHISMVEAQRACKASHKRLCHANEWKAACKGPSSSRYPYGDARVANACVDTNRTSPMTLLYGGERSGRTLNDPRANQQANTL